MNIPSDKLTESNLSKTVSGHTKSLHAKKVCLTGSVTHTVFLFKHNSSYFPVNINRRLKHLGWSLPLQAAVANGASSSADCQWQTCCRTINIYPLHMPEALGNLKWSCTCKQICYQKRRYKYNLSEQAAPLCPVPPPPRKKDHNETTAWHPKYICHIICIKQQRHQGSNPLSQTEGNFFPS